MKLELSIHASRLKNVAGLMKGISDPFAVATQLNTSDIGRGKAVVLGKTEVVKNNLSPDWAKVFILDYELGTPLKVAINMFDEVRKGENIPMGHAVFDVGEILGSRGNSQCKRIAPGRDRGVIYASVRKSEGSGSLRLKVKAENLKKTDGLFSKSDPFFEMSRRVNSAGGQIWDNMYRSEVIHDDLNPTWEEAAVELSILCGGDLALPIQISVYDWKKGKTQKVIGRLETNVNALLEIGKSGTNRPMLLKKNGKDTGTLIIMRADVSGIEAPVNAFAQPQYAPPTAQMAHASINSQYAQPIVQMGSISSVPQNGTSMDQKADVSINSTVYSPVIVSAVPVPASVSASVTNSVTHISNAPPPPAVNPAYVPTTPRSGGGQKDLFVDYVSGGCELNVMVAIDFTGSNGDPRTPGTLHHIDPNSRNQYEQAIAAIVSILLQYDSDKKIPVVGFGAKYGGVVRHLFQCGSALEADGLKGVIDAYESVFRTGLIMSRPTVFNEVLEAAAERSQKSQLAAQQRGGQAYTILLIISDGAVSDVNATAACLKRISDNPLSVVIVGVGNADFRAMRFLDDYAQQSTGCRDIAQFVPFNQHSHSSQSLTKATLEEIPEQLVSYFQSKGIPPLLPVMRANNESTMDLGGDEVEEEIDLSLDITEDEIIVTGGGDYFVDGFNTR